MTFHRLRSLSSIQPAEKPSTGFLLSSASCLCSRSADCSSLILPAKGPGGRRGLRRTGDRLWGCWSWVFWGTQAHTTGAPKPVESARFCFPHSASRPQGEGARAAAVRTGQHFFSFKEYSRCFCADEKVHIFHGSVLSSFMYSNVPSLLSLLHRGGMDHRSAAALTLPSPRRRANAPISTSLHSLVAWNRGMISLYNAPRATGKFWIKVFKPFLSAYS